MHHEKEKLSAKPRCKVVCSDCNKTFRGKYEHDEHILIEHEEQRWACKIKNCRKEYRSFSGYLNHKVRVHGFSYHRSKKCNECSMEFSMKTQLLDHLRVHHSAEKLVCDRCGSYFGYQSNFDRHKRTCNATKRISCEICGKGFDSKKYLRQHIQGQHRKPKYCCNMCSLKFPYRSSLVYHCQKCHLKT